LLIELEQPGVTIRPIISMTGEHHFNEVVFDGVFVPDVQVVGAIGEGWAQVTSELAYERSGPERLLSTFVLLDTLVGELALRSRSGDLPAVGVPADVAGGGRGARRGRGARDRGGAGQGRRDAVGERDHRGSPDADGDSRGRARSGGIRDGRAAGAGGPARARVHAARRHQRDPARHRGPRAGPAVNADMTAADGERELLRRTVEDLLARHCTAARVAAAAAGAGWDAGLWQALEE